jgi:hypothetical protein
MHEFIQQYVTENNEHEFICKSCGIILNMKNYVADGVFDDEGKFRTFNIPMNIPLEDIPEYEKVDKTLKTIDKIIEKICNMSNITYFVGSSTTIKWRRKDVNKNVIDMLLSHNKVLKPIYKERNEMTNKKYGIIRELNNLFYFDVDNNIFVYSSKEKDYYKLIKANNVVTYILIMLLLELNENHILSMGYDKSGRIDKICNIENYNKGGNKLLSDLKIIKNKSGDVSSLTEFPLLMYTIYYFSCVLTKHKLWYLGDNISGKAEDKKFSVLMQKTIIHTTVDTLNSILEICLKPKKKVIYDIFSTRFFIKLMSLYNSEEIFKQLGTLKEEHIKKKERIPIKKPEGKTILLKLSKINSLTVTNYKGFVPYVKPRVSYLELHNQRKQRSKRIEQIDFRTVCPSGNFHTWIVHGSTFSCKECGISSDDLFKPNYPDRSDDKIRQFRYNNLYNRIANKYCELNDLHVFTENGKKQCRDNKFTINELEHISNIIDDELSTYKSQISNQNDIREDYINRIKQQQSKIKHDLKTQYDSTGHDITSSFVKLVESLIGQDTNINNNNVWLIDDAYIIDHDYLGNNLDNKTFVINKKVIKINYKENHPHFNTNVIYYADKQRGYIELFYDAISLIYLGYKESNKNYVDIKLVEPKFLKIKYSVVTKLKLLGCVSMFIPNETNSIVKNLSFTDSTESKYAFMTIFGNIVRERIRKLKYIIATIQKIIYLVKYNKEEKNLDQKPVDQITDGIEKIVNKHKKNLEDSLKMNDVFTDWMIVCNGIYYQNPKHTINIDTKQQWFNALDIGKLDDNGNLLLYYVIREFEKMIRINTGKTLQISIIHFVIDIIDVMYDYYTIDKQKVLYDVKRFIYILESGKYDAEAIAPQDLEGLYQEDLSKEELDDPERQEDIEDTKEAFDALDIDGQNQLEDDDTGLRDFTNIEDRES